MMKIILISKDSYKKSIINKIINHLDFHLRENLFFMALGYNCLKITNELEEKDYEKIFIIDIDEIEISTKIAKYIRKKDFSSTIIFISNNKKNLDKCYNTTYNIFAHLLVDNFFCQNLKKSIISIVSNKDDENMFCYSNKLSYINIDYKKILYIYRDTFKRKTIIVTKNNKFPLNITLKDTQLYLDKRFKRCHRACILNKTRVHDLEWNGGYFILDTGSKINLLSKKYKDIVND